MEIIDFSLKEVYFKKGEDLTPILKYKPERDIPLAVRDLNTLSGVKISEWILNKFKVKRSEDSVEKWFERHPDVKVSLEKEITEKALQIDKEVKEEDKTSIYEMDLLKYVKSCDTCAYAKEIIEEESIKKILCRKVNKFVKFKRLCVNYKSVSCITCLYLIELIYVDEIFLKKGSNRYNRYDVWSIKCEKEGLMKNIRIKSNDTERVLPNCSLWKWKGDKKGR